jgi:membrane protease subunit HflC
MKRAPVTLVAGCVLLVIFALMLFAFQVRQTQVAVVTTFGKYSRTITEPGLNWRLPWPIQKVYHFDNRIHTFNRRFEQTATRDGRSLLVTVFVGWRIADPRVFLERFQQGDLAEAERTLESQIRDTKNGVVSQYDFANFVSTDPAQLKFDEIEQRMTEDLRPKVLASYGIEVRFVGIRQLGLPESITAKVFERMREERQQLVKQFTGEGEAEAIRIRAEAERQRAEILARAEAEATVMRGQAEAEAAKSLAVFEQNPKLANFLLDLKALEQSLKERATLILDQQTPPFNMLQAPQEDAGKR